MRLTWRDGIETILFAAVVLVAVATIQAWGWPLLGSYRSAALVVFAIGAVMCPLSGSAASTISAKQNPYIALATVLGVASLVMAIVVLFTASEAWFVALAATIGALWLVTTFRHLVQGPAGPQIGRPIAAS